MLWKKPCWVVTCTCTITRQNDYYTGAKNPNPTQQRVQDRLALPLAEESFYPIYSLREVEEVEELG